MMTAAAAAPARSFRVFARIMDLSLMFFPLDGTAQRPPSECSGVQIVSATHTGDKRMSVGKCMPADGTTAAHYLHTAASARSVLSQGSSRIAYARQIEIVMRPA